MRLAHVLVPSTLLMFLAAGCGVSTTPSTASSTASAATAEADTTKAKKGPTSKGKQTFEKRRTYSAASPDGPPSKY
jgi:hypothetical protein